MKLWRTNLIPSNFLSSVFPMAAVTGKEVIWEEGSPVEGSHSLREKISLSLLLLILIRYEPSHEGSKVMQLQLTLVLGPWSWVWHELEFMTTNISFEDLGLNHSEICEGVIAPAYYQSNEIHLCGTWTRGACLQNININTSVKYLQCEPSN